MTAPNAIDKLELRNEIVRLTVKGLPPAEIAASVGLQVGTVKFIVKEEYTARLANRADLIGEHKLELDWMRRKVKEKIEQSEGTWNRQDMYLLLKVSESERKLFGLDAPTRLELKSTDELTDEELAEECRRAGIETVPRRLPEAIPDAEIVAPPPRSE